MSWHGVIGHDAVFERFRRAIGLGRLASTFLFVGPQGVGKRLTALRIAQALFCERHAEAELTACGVCPACQMVLAGSHPDLDVVARPPDRAVIPVELFIGDREHRLREGLCHRIAMKPALASRRIGVIDDADFMKSESANCLLKTLEEPPPRSLLILIGTSLQKQLPTIRSRCQIVRFQPLETDDLAALLRRTDPALPVEELDRLVHLADGSPDRARELADPELREFAEHLWGVLGDGPFSAIELAKETQGFIEAIAKETPPRRRRTLQVLGLAVEFYRQLMRRLSGVEPQGDRKLLAAVEQAAGRWTQGVDQAAACLERSLEAQLEVERNAHLTTLVECWLDDLAELACGRLVRDAGGW